MIGLEPFWLLTKLFLFSPQILAKPSFDLTTVHNPVSRN